MLYSLAWPRDIYSGIAMLIIWSLMVLQTGLLIYLLKRPAPPRPVHAGESSESAADEGGDTLDLRRSLEWISMGNFVQIRRDDDT